MSKRLPRSAGDITPAKLSGERIKIFASLVLTLAQNELERGPIVSALRNVTCESANQLGDVGAGAVGRSGFRGAVVGILTGSAVFDYTSAFELGEVTGDAGLAH